MREIRFRALTYCATCGEHGFQHWVWNGQQFLEDGISRPCQCPLKCEMDGKIQRCVDVVDENGKSIYEGDIVKVPYNGNIGVIKFGFFQDDLRDQLGFWIDWPESAGYANTFADWVVISKNKLPFEVIGNIHETPDLLK